MSRLSRIGEILADSPTWALSTLWNFSPVLPCGDEFDFQGEKQILIPGPRFFVKSKKYSGLWVSGEQTSNLRVSDGVSSSSILRIENTVARIFRVTYADDKYFVLARLEQNREVFDISSEFGKDRPLMLSPGSGPKLENFLTFGLESDSPRLAFGWDSDGSAEK
jgi:hypothetical protein